MKKLFAILLIAFTIFRFATAEESFLKSILKIAAPFGISLDSTRKGMLINHTTLATIKPIVSTTDETYGFSMKIFYEGEEK